ncbi:MAG: hypothetical protein U9P79_00595 [Candidatus Cloacimonadota bacterium]|nr:hypothetical protein [Candidatus Cloacimonadota bacterium]
MEIIIRNLSEDPNLVNEINRLHEDPWPIFLNHDAIVKKYWRRLYKKFPKYQLLFKIGNEYVGVGNTAPIYIENNILDFRLGFDEVLENIFTSNKRENTLCGLAAVISKKYSGRGISYKIIDEFKKLAHRNGFTNLVLPVRPILKSQYPLIPLEKYIRWECDGLPFDPWIRVHVKIGGKILKVANRSMIVKGTVSEWEDWTGMHLGDNGDYIIQGALNPVKVDLQKNLGKYIEPNVWILHKC